MFNQIFRSLDVHSEEFYQKWYNRVSHESFEKHEAFLGIDEDDQESWQEDFDEEEIEESDCSTNGELKDRFPKKYNKKWEDFKKAKIEKTVREWFDEQLNLFSAEFDRHTAFKNGHVIGYRKICVKNIDDFIQNLTQKKYQPGFAGVGIYWSWDLLRAEAHGGDGSYPVTLEARIPLSSVDLLETVLCNLDPSLGYDEAEIRLIEGGEIELLSVDEKKLGPVILKA